MRELFYRILYTYQPDMWLAAWAAEIDPQSYMAGIVAMLIYGHLVKIAADERNSTSRMWRALEKQASRD